MPDKFIYLGNTNNFRQGTSSFDYSQSTVKKNAYVFVQPDKNNIVSRGLIIDIYSISSGDGMWLSDVFSWMKRRFRAGKQKIDGTYYEHAYLIYKHGFGKKIEALLDENGYILPQCKILGGLGRRLNSDKTRVIIYYFENVTYRQSGSTDCKDWYGKVDFEGKQNRHINNFISRQDDAVMISHTFDKSILPLEKAQ